MINYCIRVLQEPIEKTNTFAITKPVAIILLAHYVGDIRQPLHVGAEYFDPLLQWSGDVIENEIAKAVAPCGDSGSGGKVGKLRHVDRQRSSSAR